MAVASVVFMLLAIFYYEYVPEGAYDEGTFKKLFCIFDTKSENFGPNNF